jgi:tetratricopeptide (TPR) repeat protein
VQPSDDFMPTLNIKDALQRAVQHHQSGRLAEAEEIYRQILVVEPDQADALHLLGVLAGQTGKPEMAIELLNRAIAARPDFADAHSNLGMLLRKNGRLDEALTAYRRALAIMPNNPLTHEAIGIILSLQQQIPAAAASYRSVLALAPQMASAWNGLGVALRSMGEFDEAAACFRRALAIRPGMVNAYSNLIHMGRKVADPMELDRLFKSVNDPAAPLEDRIMAGFSLGKSFDEADRFDEAFEQYSNANALVKESRAVAGERFDWQAMQREVDHIIETFTPNFFEQRRGWGEASELPVFIVGMPRSGTSLVEQIASSHSKVFGAGELKEIGAIFDGLAQGISGPPAQAWTEQAIKQAAKSHLKQLASLGGPAVRVIDKMPGNVVYLGLIATMFPGAKVIFCRRDPLDNCLSCYFQRFNSGNLFSYGLVDCGQRYLGIERLTNHWLHTLPLAMLEMRYEKVVADLERQSRRLIGFLGLDWEPACLEFHRTKRTVPTASAWQVRQPIYSNSIGRWRHYEGHLAELIEVLNGNEKR